MLGEGLSSIGEGLSTFTLWPSTDYERYIRDFDKRYLEKAPGYDEYLQGLNDAGKGRSQSWAQPPRGKRSPHQAPGKP